MRSSVLGSAQQEFPQIYPQPGWVEHDPAAIWTSVTATVERVLDETGIDTGDIAGIGITNQRETTLVWDRETGECIHNAIVWQDRRTAAFCRQLQEAGHKSSVTEKTGTAPRPLFLGHETCVAARQC